MGAVQAEVLVEVTEGPCAGKQSQTACTALCANEKTNVIGNKIQTGGGREKGF